MAEENKALPDVVIENHGSLYLFRVHNVAALEWFATHTDAQLWANAYVVEPRYVAGIARALVDEGFMIE